VTASEWTDRDAIAKWGEMPRDAIGAMGPNGDFEKEHLLNPTMLRMLGDVYTKRVLDAGCGQGYFSRLLAYRGAHVVGVEPASALFDHAVDIESRHHHGIRYVQEDLSTLSDLGRFDAVVASLVFMAIPDWRNAMRRCIESLSSDGVFVFSLCHPCFEAVRSSWVTHRSVIVREYLHEYEVPRPYAPDFHRPMSEYLNHVLALGCTLIELAEPSLDPSVVMDGPEGVDAYIHVPPFMIVAARHA